MDIARTSMIHAAAPHFLWPFAVRYAAHQLNLWPRVSLPFTTPLRAVSSLPRTSRLTSRFPFTVSSPTALPLPCPRHSSLLPGAEREGVEREGAEPGEAETGGVEPGGSAGASLRLCPQQLREWFVRHASLRSGATGVGGAGAAGGGGAGVAARAGVTGGTAATGPGGARTRGAGAGDPTESEATGAGGSGAGGAGAEGAGVGGTCAGGAGAGGAGAVDPGGAVWPRVYFVPLLQQSGGLTERREPTSRPVSPVRTARRVPRSRPPPVHGTHAMTLRPSFVPLRVPLPAPPESSLLADLTLCLTVLELPVPLSLVSSHQQRHSRSKGGCWKQAILLETKDGVYED
ncbi:unnamed protein product [Closterium sp. NIES-53]